MHKFKRSTDVAARALQPTLITEDVTPDLYFKQLYDEHSIETRFPGQFDYMFALHGEGVSIVDDCAQLQNNSRVVIEAEAKREPELQAQFGFCNNTNLVQEAMQERVAIPLFWFGKPILAAVGAAYDALGEHFTEYQKQQQ